MAIEKDFRWKDEYSVGIYGIDRQHKEIISMLRDLHLLGMTDDKKSHETFKTMLYSVTEYIKHHFWDEEKQMDKMNYPGYIEHKEQHCMLLQEINEMCKKIGKDETLSIKNVSEYLIMWYSDHLIGLDKEMGVHFKRSKN